MTSPTPRFTCADSVLSLDGVTVFAGVPMTTTPVDDPLGTGVFLRTTAETAADRHLFVLGTLPAVRRYVAIFRYDPWWVKPGVGTTIDGVPCETQCLLGELTDGRYLVLLPLLDGPFYSALQGEADATLTLVAETGDPAVVATEVTALFVAVGEDPYALMTAAAASAAAAMGRGRLRGEKPLPAFVDHFGWCTWDAFYGEVSHEKIQQGLESFAAGGVNPRFLIIDDGWLSLKVQPTGEKRLASFEADAGKFPGGLWQTVAMAKGEFDIERIFVWHTLQGYWGGVDGEALPRYRVDAMARSYSPGLLTQFPNANNAEWMGKIVGLVAPDDSYRFFQDFHRFLADQGIDGVKVDNQGSLDGLGHGHGGVASLMGTYHEALEGAVQTHFLGNLINCMSVSLNMAYQTKASTVTRSYTDFWPNDPASHGLHQYANAINCLWLGEFIHPDWDMFQSGHAMGAYHAASRAISGGPVYVSDKPDGHDFAVLRKLVLSDGTIPRAEGIARATRDCLFTDPTTDDVLLKIFNTNHRAGVVGLFNARYHAEEGERVTLTGTVSPADVEGLTGTRFAVYAHEARTLTLCDAAASLPVTLPELAFELFTFVPIEAGVAPIGLADKYNSAGAITAKGPDPRGGYFVALRDGGDFLAWCETAPAAVFVDDAAADFTYDPSTGTLAVTVPVGGAHLVRLT
jgi:raffinose synthase